MEQGKKAFLKKNLPILGILFILGIIFLATAEYDSNKGNDRLGVNFDEEAYTENLEQRLGTMLEKMDGVEEACVMITLESSSRYQFAGQDGQNLQGSTYTGAFLMQESAGGSKEPILVEIGSPKIKGVSVVCRGAENIPVREKIINLISGTLNLPKNKIYVTE